MYVQLGNQANVLQSSGPVVAGTTNINGSVIDMQGFECLLVIVSLGALTATQNTKLKLQSGTLANGSDMSDVANSGVPAGATTFVPDADSNKFIVGDYVRCAIPPNRYVRPVVVRGVANAVINAVYSIQYNVSRAPVQTAFRDANLSGTVVTVVEQKQGTAN